MSAHSRLHTALSAGLIALPAGPVSVLRPPADYDLAAISGQDLTISHGYYPDLAAWQAAGFSCTRVPHPAPTAIVVVPRSKDLARSMVAEAANWAELVIVDGRKTDGVDSLFRACRGRLGDLPSVAKAHGRLFWFDPAGAFRDWPIVEPHKGNHGFYTIPGGFSDNAVDPGSALLAAALPDKLGAKVCDLGAGWGYLAAAILTRSGIATLDLVEAEALSLDCARRNITDPRARFHWADATRFTAEGSYDCIVMNPPFHTGRVADPALGRAFIAAAGRLLAPHGKLYMVANRHLPYETALTAAFRQVDEQAGNGAFKIFVAARPVR